MISPPLQLVMMILNLYGFMLLVWIILSLLITFNIINPYQPFVKMVSDVLYRLTEPVLRFVRRFVPTIGGVDLSPIAVFIAIRFIEYTIIYYSQGH
jgi:YggT family protein